MHFVIAYACMRDKISMNIAAYPHLYSRSLTREKGWGSIWEAMCNKISMNNTGPPVDIFRPAVVVGGVFAGRCCVREGMGSIWEAP